jgi:galactoside O-acetyltransferase
MGIECGSNISVHKTVQFFGNNIVLGSNVRIDCFCVISSNEKISIGNYVHLGPYVALMGRAGITIEDFAGLSARVSVFTATDDYRDGHLTNPTVPERLRQTREAPVLIGKHAVIGAGTVILPGVEIGKGASVGALSLVQKSVPPYAIALGSPVREIGKRDAALLERLERDVTGAPSE